MKSFSFSLNGFLTAAKSIIGPKKKTEEVAPKPQSFPPKPALQKLKSVVVTPVAPSVLEIDQKAKEIVFEAREEAFRIKKAAEEETVKIRENTLQLEKRLVGREEAMERRLGGLEEREKQILGREEESRIKIAEIEKVKQEQLAKLERAAGLTQEEAKALILDALGAKLKEEMGRMIKGEENRAKEEADKKAREILVDAMHKAATDYVAEYTVSVVKLADEEMKGRIIGKEGRNIRSLEQETGVDFNIDETPGEIRLSSFDPVRREIAKISLEKLIIDGRIHPARIEELVAKTKKDIEKIIFAEGEKLCHTVGVYNLPADKIALLGRFKYRFSYGQNMITHTLEETKIGVALANEVGADVNIVRLGCLLHDIGKVITDEEGTHVQLAVDLLRKNNMPSAIIDCVAQHHEDTPFTSIEAVLVYIADAISGSRPGARYEDLTEYTKKMEQIEEQAKSIEGVKEAYAISAGRELRVIVESEKISDALAAGLAKEIAEKVEKNCTYPGQVKVTVIRETRASEIAK